jgi:hypothetical protein
MGRNAGGSERKKTYQRGEGQEERKEIKNENIKLVVPSRSLGNPFHWN